MRTLFWGMVLFVVTVALTWVLTSDARSTHYAKEKIFTSRTCPDGNHWILDESDDQSVTVVCYALQEDDDTN